MSVPSCVRFAIALIAALTIVALGTLAPVVAAESGGSPPAAPLAAPQPQQAGDSSIDAAAWRERLPIAIGAVVLVLLVDAVVAARVLQQRRPAPAPSRRGERPAASHG